MLKKQNRLLKSNNLSVLEGGYQYEYDILNDYENLNMDIQFALSLILLFAIIKNLFNVKFWCKENKVKPYKLYCINCTALSIIIS